MNLGLDGQAALVTGAGRGIGAAIARELAAEGCAVLLVDRDAMAEAEAVAREITRAGGRALARRADVASLAEAEEAVAACHRELGRLDILVCNAGITGDAVIWKMAEAAWDQVLLVNLKGCFTFCRAAAPGFRAQGHGRIVTIGSINGLRGKRGQANYAAAKAGIVALTKTLARELGPHGVTANCVAPGLVRTGMTAALPEPVLAQALAESALGRAAEPEDIARVVVFLCSEAARHVTGAVIQVDGGQYL